MVIACLTLFRMGFFRAAHGWGVGWGGERGGGKKDPLTKICHRYPTMMNLGTVIPYLKMTQKIYEFSPEISKFCYVKKYMYRLHFDTEFLILLTFLESLNIILKIILIKKVTILMMSAKMAAPGLLKEKVF